MGKKSKILQNFDSFAVKTQKTSIKFEKTAQNIIHLKVFISSWLYILAFEHKKMLGTVFFPQKQGFFVSRDKFLKKFALKMKADFF